MLWSARVYAGSILICHDPLTIPTDQATIGDDNADCGLVSSVTGSTSLADSRGFYGYYSTAIPSYLSGVSADSSVTTRVFVNPNPGEFVQARANIAI